MKPTRHSKKPSSLSEPFQRRLNSYALAASAAGVSVLALTGPAEGKIVYRSAHLVMDTSNSQIYYPIDLNHDGVRDFSFVAYAEAGMSSQFAFLRCNPLGENDVWGAVQGRGDEAALKPGVRLGPGGHYASHISMALAYSVRGRSGFQGPWANGGKGVKDRYLGLKFAINGKTHYGWARLNVKVGRLDNEVYIKATLTGYAYETIPNKSIIAGRTHGGASLGALAAGSTALSSRRHKIRSK